jgi:hypothetical protein
MPLFRQNTGFSRGVTLNGVSTGEYLVKNWHIAKNTPGLGKATTYHGTAKRWFSASYSTTTTYIYTSIDGVDWEALPTISNFQVASALLTPQTSEGATGLRIGGGLSTNTTSKIYLSNDLGATWTPTTIGANDNAIVSALAYNTNGHYAVIGTAVWHSATGSSASYTSVVTMSNTGLLNGVATNGSTLAVALCVAGSTYYTSTDGTTWVPRTLPNSLVATGITYGTANNTSSAFYVSGVDSTGPAIYVSFSGTGSWTLLKRFAVTTAMGGIAIVAGCIVAQAFLAGAGANTWYSLDAGVTWLPSTFYPNGSTVEVIPAANVGEVHHQVGVFYDGFSKVSLVG